MYIQFFGPVQLAFLNINIKNKTKYKQVPRGGENRLHGQGRVMTYI